MAPQRVPITNPSSGVSPIVVSRLRPSCKRAKARAVAEMGDHGALGRKLRRDVGEPACDIFERQAVKAVAADAALFIASRNGEAARGRR